MTERQGLLGSGGLAARDWLPLKTAGPSTLGFVVVAVVEEEA